MREPMLPNLPAKKHLLKGVLFIGAAGIVIWIALTRESRLVLAALLMASIILTILGLTQLAIASVHHRVNREDDL